MTIAGLLFASIVIDIIAIVAVLWCLADALADLRATEQLGIVNGRKIVAWSDVRGQGVRLAAVMVLGAMTLLVLPLVERGREPSTVGFAIMLMFTTVHLLMAANAVMDLGMRRKLAQSSREKLSNK